MAERINLWQHCPGTINGDDLLGMVFDHADLIPSLRGRYIPNGEYLFESSDPEEGLRLFDAFVSQYLVEYDATGKFSALELAMLSEHIWNGSIRFESDGTPPIFQSGF